MHEPQLNQLICHSRFYRVLDIDHTGVQLPSLIATIEGLKPAMDIWVQPRAWKAFESLAKYFGLQFHVDSYFDRFAESALNQVPQENFTTTRAALSQTFTDRSEAHVFIARTRPALIAAVSAGWYPLVVDGYVVEKHLADHEKFGEALGYPACCCRFFRWRNNWYRDNTYYAAYRNTEGTPQIRSNGLLRHTAFYLTPHLPCSFGCDRSMAYADELSRIITAEMPAYAQEIERQLASPILCLSELKIYRFEGTLTAPDRVQYAAVQPVNPTTQADGLLKTLAQGNTLVLDGNVLRILNQGLQIGTYVARADHHGPEYPFVIQCA